MPPVAEQAAMSSELALAFPDEKATSLLQNRENSVYRSEPVDSDEHEAACLSRSITAPTCLRFMASTSREGPRTLHDQQFQTTLRYKAIHTASESPDRPLPNW